MVQSCSAQRLPRPQYFFCKLPILNWRAVVHYVSIVLVSAKREKIKESQIQGFKYFKAISSILDSVHNAGCQRDRAGNRKLHMDQYMSLLLLYMFNPICTSLRAVQQASELKKVQRKLGCPRASLGSLSEAATVFDSALMQEIVTALADQLKPISCFPSAEMAQVNAFG